MLPNAIAVVTLLLGENQQRERVEYDCRPRARIFGRGRGSRTEVRRDRINVVIARVQRHGAGTGLGLDGIDDGVFVRRILVRRSDGAIAARRECQLGGRIEPGGIDAVPNRYLGNGFPRGVVHHYHLLIVTAREEPLVRGINGQAAG